MWKNKRIVLGVCGGIAAYKAVSLLRLMKKAGADVRVVMTSSALEFVGEPTFRVLSENDVCTGLFNSNEASVRHIDWANEADAVVIAPATANIIGKLAGGIADDALSTMMMAVRSPIMICPSMNTYMYESRAVQRNLDTLEQDGMTILEPGSGELACQTSGAGRLPEPEVIFDRLERLFHSKDLQGKKVLMTAGPTREAIDPVRYISNHSSGKMGYAIAEAAEKRGAAVMLVSGPVSLQPPLGVEVVKVQSAHEMADAVLGAMDDTDIIIKVAAVADYRPADPKENKIKKDLQNKEEKDNAQSIEDRHPNNGNIKEQSNSETSKTKADPAERLIVDLIENPDILKMAGERKKDQFLAGFAAETENLDANALAKIRKKNLDMIVGNIVGVENSGFEADTNKVTFFFKDGTTEDLPLTSKKEVAHTLLDRILERSRHSSV